MKNKQTITQVGFWYILQMQFTMGAWTVSLILLAVTGMTISSTTESSEKTMHREKQWTWDKKKANDLKQLLFGVGSVERHQELNLKESLQSDKVRVGQTQVHQQDHEDGSTRSRKPGKRRYRRRLEIVPPFVNPESVGDGLFHRRRYRDLTSDQEAGFLPQNHRAESANSDLLSRKRRSSRKFASYFAWRKRNGYGNEIVGRWGRSLPPLSSFSLGDKATKSSNSQELGAGPRGFGQFSSGESEALGKPRQKRSSRARNPLLKYLHYRSRHGYGSTKYRWG